ncbi:integrase catalytic domain-containing protein [Caerostris extrusa]|uniref:Integrase catalytic domain-containing protein n=1 Tax=Caerostris extrusa TaxID=172846 RepID=A0AAV4WD36_CAEEX|nr:integrase catalytic domain-containing protein [Caerostris extrusa]
MLTGTRAYELIESYPLTSKTIRRSFLRYGAFWVVFGVTSSPLPVGSDLIPSLKCTCELKLLQKSFTCILCQQLRHFSGYECRAGSIYTTSNCHYGGRQNRTAYVTFCPEQELSLQNVEPISPVLGLKWIEDRRSSVNFEELLTILCDVEASINSRPLTYYVSDDSDELIPLTPSLCLQDIKQVGVPSLDSVDTNNRNVRVNHCNTLRSELRSRFRKEYFKPTCAEGQSHMPRT